MESGYYALRISIRAILLRGCSHKTQTRAISDSILLHFLYLEEDVPKILNLKGITTSISIPFLLILLFLIPRIAPAEDRPRVMFMIAEQNIGDKIFTYWWSRYSRHVAIVTPHTAIVAGETGIERQTDIQHQRFDFSVGETILKEEFLNTGFDVIDIASVSDKIKVSEAYGVLDIAKQATLELGKDVSADIVITGKIIARRGPTDTGSNVGTYMADITATAFRVKDGLVLASGRESGVARHISEITGGSQAIERASQKLAKKMIEQMNTKLGK